MKIKKEKGITLIALIITIILMLILAGVVISLTIGNNGLIEKTKYAVEENRKAEIKEEIEIAILDIQSKLEEQKDSKGLSKTIIVENLPNEINSIVIKEDMTGEYKGYEYYIDGEYKVHVGTKTTNPIKVKITPTYIGTSSCTIEVEATSTKGNIVNYQYRVNDEIKQETDKNTDTIEGLNPTTQYMITVVVIDEKGNTKTSMPVTIETKERTYIVKDGVAQVEAKAINATIQKENNYSVVTTNKTTNRGGCAFLYDITKYKKIKVDIEVVKKDKVSSGCMIALSYFNNPLKDNWNNYEIIASYDETTKQRDVYNLNIENVEKEMWIVCLKNSTNPATTATMHIYNLWLEE